ncbi:MAG TPA: family 16 glycosylhydrolase, partial [Thermoanaerobaculia bacterium]|nr:family 16 glycosylhydrolase [Thermoanaerobaculia bacterium]
MRSQLLLAAALTAVFPLPAAAHATEAAAVNWQLVWADEFNAPDGAEIDRAKWVPEVGGNGWGNNELEFYRDDPANAHLESGVLVITAVNESYTSGGVSRNYTSARLKTQGTFEQPFGRFEARIQVPYGQGIWPAFWMLGNDISTIGWPACGEIDVMENIGREPTVVHGTAHGPGYSGANGIGAPYSLPDGAPFADDFHIYAVEWEPEAIRWYVDEALYRTLTPADLPAGARWAFDHPFFMLLNLAVGGGWPGSPDATTVFPQQMLVDYVRVYLPAAGVQRPVPTACDPARGKRSSTLDVRLVGSGFAVGAKVAFGAGVSVLATTVVSPGEIQLRVKVQSNAKRGPRNVTVTNPGGKPT